MKREIIGQGAVVVLIVAVVAAVVGGAIGYLLAPAVEVPPDIAELQAKISNLEGQVTTLEDQLAAIPPKPFPGIDIWFFPGGPPGCPFATVVYNGALAAERDLGCKVTYVWSDWNPEKMVTQFREAIAAKPDGICIMGHPGDVGYGEWIEEAVNAGIIVTSQNTTLPKNEAKFFTKGFGYVGQELYEAGYTLGSACVKQLDMKAGDRAMVWGLLGEEIRGLRSKGAIDALEEAGVTVDYLDISTEVDADPSLGIPIVAGYIAEHPDVKLIVTDHGGLTSTIPAYFGGAGKEPGEIYGAGFDTLAPTVEGIKDGWIQLVLDQQQYLQGYLPILQVCLSKSYGFSGLHIDTGAGIVDITNVAAVEELAKQGIR